MYNVFLCFQIVRKSCGYHDLYIKGVWPVVFSLLTGVNNNKCQRVHFTCKIQQQFDIYCTENSWRDLVALHMVYHKDLDVDSMHEIVFLVEVDVQILTNANRIEKLIAF
jgi:hypothetical protein